MNILSHYGPFALFFAFTIVHSLADFPLQGNYLAQTKVRRQAKDFQEWFIALTAHSLIQAGGVWIVSGSAILGAVELCLHWLIDLGKGEGGFGYGIDQSLHIICKLAYVVVLTQGLLPAS
jgi:hypothetical protein